MIYISEWHILKWHFFIWLSILYSKDEFVSEWVPPDLLQINCGFIKESFTRLRACAPTVLCSIQRAKWHQVYWAQNCRLIKSSNKRFSMHLLIFVSEWLWYSFRYEPQNVGTSCGTKDGLSVHSTTPFSSPPLTHHFCCSTVASKNEASECQKWATFRYEKWLSFRDDRAIFEIPIFLCINLGIKLPIPKEFPTFRYDYDLHFGMTAAKFWDTLYPQQTAVPIFFEMIMT